jgi:hypothetical protein
MGHQGRRANVLVDLAPQLPEALVGDALAAARAIDVNRLAIGTPDRLAKGTPLSCG